jgi:hypothetical protein
VKIEVFAVCGIGAFQNLLRRKRLEMHNDAHRPALLSVDVIKCSDWYVTK